MIVVHTEQELRSALVSGKKIGFVPTMGALHEGHASLLRRSVAECEVTVLSIFVNPTQFGPGEDYSRYPKTLDADLAVAKKEGVNIVFVPSIEDIYPNGWSTYIELVGISEPLCGKFRPGHFRGVATVVYRLFQLVGPAIAYFGQKDIQQCLVIRKMVEDLRLPIQIEICPTLRDPDGLAMSSRNRYLVAGERTKALVLYRALHEVERLVGQGEARVPKLLAAAESILASVPEFQLQYSEIRSLAGLSPMEVVNQKAVFAIAGFMGKTRLIDNILLTPSLLPI